jgi:hypothetical protein
VEVSSELNFHYRLFSSPRKDLNGNQFVASSLEELLHGIPLGLEHGIIPNLNIFAPSK